MKIYQVILLLLLPLTSNSEACDLCDGNGDFDADKKTMKRLPVLMLYRMKKRTQIHCFVVSRNWLPNLRVVALAASPPIAAFGVTER
jgi:hypothetical protein